MHCWWGQGSGGLYRCCAGGSLVLVLRDCDVSGADQAGTRVLPSLCCPTNRRKELRGHEPLGQSFPATWPRAGVCEHRGRVLQAPAWPCSAQPHGRQGLRNTEISCTPGPGGLIGACSMDSLGSCSPEHPGHGLLPAQSTSGQRSGLTEMELDRNWGLQEDASACPWTGRRPARSLPSGHTW